MSILHCLRTLRTLAPYAPLAPLCTPMHLWHPYAPLLKCLARLRIAAVEAAPQPRHALLGRAVRERVGKHMARRHALNAVVADCARRAQPLFEVPRFHLDAAAGRAAGRVGLVRPHAGKAVRLQLETHREIVALRRIAGLQLTHL